MKKEIELIRELVSTVQLLQEVVYVLEQSDEQYKANEQACKCFGVQLALQQVCRIYSITAYGLEKEISDSEQE